MSSSDGLLQVVAEALAHLIILCVQHKPAAIPKILKHLHGFVCVRLERPPEEVTPTVSGRSRPSPTPGSVPDNTAERGAEAALQQLGTRLGGELPASLPELWRMATEPISTCAAEAVAGPVAPHAVREAAAALRLLHVMAPALARTLHERLAAMVPQMALCYVQTTPALERSMSAALVHLVLAMPDVHLDPVITAMLPCLEVLRSLSLFSRRHAHHNPILSAVPEHCTAPLRAAFDTCVIQPSSAHHACGADNSLNWRASGGSFIARGSSQRL